MKNLLIDEVAYLPMHNMPKFAIFSDFDETYRPNSVDKYPISGIRDLENFLFTLSQTTSFMFGWVSGGNLESILAKSKGYIKLFPHFISSSLGTELYFCKEEGICIDLDWQNNLLESGFSRTSILELISELHELGVELLYQPDRSQGDFKVSYYYKSRTNEEQDFKLIQDMAQIHAATVKISKCNPSSGDPDGFFDINFIPNNCGKHKIVEYIIKKYGILQRNTIAFGDSCNDLEMLRAVAHGFLLGNADVSAKSAFQPILAETYCFGIISGIKKVISNI